MKTLIIEDETAAARNLEAILADIEPDAEVLGVLESVSESVEWLRTHPSPDLLFMDIHLADGDSFRIFEAVEVTAPVVFTTAYDRYALEAFKVNSIDYLLKPIGAADLRRALDKLETLHGAADAGASAASGESLAELIRGLQRQGHYKSHFLIPCKGDKLLPLAVEQVQYFCIADGVTKAVVSDRERYVLPNTLDELTDSLDPARFFRVNRQYLISRGAVQDIDLWFNNRLAINLKVPTDGKILVSKLRVNDFKNWFSGS